MPKKVQVINPIGSLQQDKLQVAAYCRVSSNSEDQRNSFAAQVKAYTEEISKNPDWELAGIYADKGISGTSVKRRPEFNRLMEDCRQGKVKRILVKSVSRFARNTKECLEYVRELKLLGVSVYFEDKKIDTAHYSSEMLLAMLGSVAQEESISISNNMRWSYEKRMKNGEFNTNYPPFGYRMENGRLEICEREAEIVSWIFENYLNGISQSSIADKLQDMGYLKKGKTTVWKTRISYILQNERYMGDAILQKKYTDDFPAKELRNKGEKPLYYVTNANPAIISKDTFEKAQKLMQIHRRTAPSDQANSTLRKMIHCAECKTLFRRKQMKNGTVSWVCYEHERNKHLCPTPPIAEELIEQAFIRMFNLLHAHMDAILYPMLHQLRRLQDKTITGSVDINTLNAEITKLSGQIHALNGLRAKGYMEPTAFQEKLNGLNALLDTVQLKRMLIVSSQTEDQVLERTEELIEIIEHAPSGLASLEDGEVFSMMVDKVLVDKSKRIVFRLINGIELIGDGGKRDDKE